MGAGAPQRMNYCWRTQKEEIKSEETGKRASPERDKNIYFSFFLIRGSEKGESR
jgi:hypothetical protein